MKVSELEGALLDYWVGRAAELPISMLGGMCIWQQNMKPFNPSINWAQGGVIIDRERIEFGRQADDMWGAWIGDLAFDEPGNPTATGPTHLIAAMRAYVASKFGEEVPGSAN